MPITSWPFAILDVFTDRPLAGNRLAVFPDAGPIPEPLLHPLAREINFSETVFVYPPAAGGDAQVRIFTPAAELLFAGHPILGTAVLLGLDRNRDEIGLETGAGLVPVSLRRRGSSISFGRMAQPVPSLVPLTNPASLLAALGVARSTLPIERYDNGPTHVYVALPDDQAVAALRPDLAALAAAVAPGEPIVSVNCFAGAGRRWKTRMFAPVERLEDPATGSAAGPLAVHLARHGRIAWGDEIEIAQGAEVGRPSALLARALGARDRIERVEVGGSAVAVARGAFYAVALDPGGAP